MARIPLTRGQRTAQVQTAIGNLAAAYAAAMAAESTHGAASPYAVAAWETVEQYGATVHRQSRLLAGKSKGG